MGPQPRMLPDGSVIRLQTCPEFDGMMALDVVQHLLDNGKCHPMNANGLAAAIAEALMALHPHANCPACVNDRANHDLAAAGTEVSDDELVAFLVENQGRRSWSENVARLKAKWKVVKR